MFSGWAKYNDEWIERSPNTSSNKKKGYGDAAFKDFQALPEDLTYKMDDTAYDEIPSGTDDNAFQWSMATRVAEKILSGEDTFVHPSGESYWGYLMSAGMSKCKPPEADNKDRGRYCWNLDYETKMKYFFGLLWEVVELTTSQYSQLESRYGEGTEAKPTGTMGRGWTYKVRNWFITDDGIQYELVGGKWLIDEVSYRNLYATRCRAYKQMGYALPEECLTGGPDDVSYVDDIQFGTAKKRSFKAAALKRSSSNRGENIKNLYDSSKNLGGRSALRGIFESSLNYK
jgi:hypothetical protein